MFDVKKASKYLFTTTAVMRAVIVAASLAATATLTQAAGVSIFNTGVNSNGDPLSPGSLELHWNVVAGPNISSPTAAFVETNPSPLYISSPTSRWIWVEADAVAAFNAPYTFETQFDLTGMNLATTILTGAWAVDNNGGILLNGSNAVGTGTLSLAGIQNSHFNSLHNFSINSGFVDGINRLQFRVTDAGLVGGLNVSNLSITASPNLVPEPSSLLLSLLAIAGLTRRTRR